MKSERKLLCLKCEKSKDLNCFRVKQGRKYKLEDYCNLCLERLNNQNNRDLKDFIENEFVITKKECKFCKNSVDLNNFEESKGYFLDICNDCKYSYAYTLYKKCICCKQFIFKTNFLNKVIKRCNTCRKKMNKNVAKQKRQKDPMFKLSTNIRNLI